MLKKFIMKLSNVNGSIVLMLVLVLAMIIHSQVESQHEEHTSPVIEHHSDPGEFLENEAPGYFEFHGRHEPWEQYVPEACQDKEKDGFGLPADSSEKDLSSKGC